MVGDNKKETSGTRRREGQKVRGLTIREKKRDKGGGGPKGGNDDNDASIKVLNGR